MGAIATSFVICVLYAITDELHQSIVPGRGPSRFDIMIDSLGAFTGITFYLIISNIKNKISGRHFWKK
jgi:VanZ family protein